MRGAGTTGHGRRRGVEAVLVVSFLSAVMAAAFGSHVTDGGFYSDDWPTAAFERGHGYFGSVRESFGVLGSKPLLAVLLPVPHELFGDDPRPQLALALALGVVTAGLFYAVLRALGLIALEAAAIAGLLVLFPWSDSMRLWITGSLNQVALILYLLAVLSALGGLHASGRAAILRHGAAAALYAASVLTYDAVAALALITGIVYLRFAPPRRALALWAADATAVGAATVYSALTTAKDVRPLRAQLENAWDMAHGAAALAANALVPADVPHVAVGVCAVAIVAAAGRLWRRDSQLRLWLVTAAAAAVAAGAGYVMFVPAAYWTPQHPGLENRVNLVAALGVVTLVYAVIRLAARLALRSQPRRWELGASLLATLAVAVGYVARVEDDKALWAQADDEQRQVLEALRRAVPDPPPGSTIFVFGHRAAVAPRLPVFYDNFDLWGAARLTYRDASLAAYPVFAGARFACGRAALIALALPSPNPAQYIDVWSYGNARTPYGRAWFADARTAEGVRLSDRATCRRVVRRLSAL